MPAESPATSVSSQAASRARSLARVWLDPRFLLWNLLTLAACPLVLMNKAYRYFRGRRLYEFETVRWTVRPESEQAALAWKSAPGPRVVLAGVSFGEAMMMEAVSKALRAKRPDVAIAHCIRDPHSRRLISRANPELAVLPWPYEFMWPISKWLGRFDPDVLLFTQSFRNRPLAIAAGLYGTAVAMFAGKIRPRKSAYYRLAKPLYRWLLGAFQGLMLQDEESCAEARRFAGPRTRVVLTGDIKFDLAPQKLSAERREDLDRWLGSGPMVAAGSTESEAEDRMVLEAFFALRTEREAQLLHAPRRTDRAAEVAGLALELGLTVSRRSLGEGPADVMLLDTLGELAHAYSACQAAYVGGAFDGEGHNVMEPLVFGVPVCYGMRRGHFEQMQKACEAEGLGRRIRTSSELTSFWQEMLADPGQREQVRVKAAAILERERGALARTVDGILCLLP